MAEHLVASALTEEQWSDQVFVEYQRNNRFSRYTGSSLNNIVRRVEEYKTDYGDKITVPFFDQLDGEGAAGNETLDGNEEDMTDNGHQILLDWRRHAIKFSKREQNKTRIQLDMMAKELLANWAKEQTRGGSKSSSKYLGVIDAMTAMDGRTPYATAGATLRNTFVTNNADRVLFGAASSNYSTTMATALANIDNTADKLDADMLSRAKEIAINADPAIGPYRTSEDEEWYVVFAGSRAFRDLKADADIRQVNREAWVRAAGQSNPLFTDGDLIWDGMIIRQIPEIPILTGAGAGSIDVDQAFLCGVGSVGMAIGQRPKRTQSDNTDYGFRKGIGIEELIGIEKLFRGAKQNGMVSIYCAGVAS